MEPSNVMRPMLKVDRDTLVPLGLLVSVVLAGTGGAWSLSSKLADFAAAQMQSSHEREKAMLMLSAQVEALRVEIGGLRQQVQENTDDRWQFHDMRSWTELLQAKNSNLNVPPPERGR